MQANFTIRAGLKDVAGEVGLYAEGSELEP